MAKSEFELKDLGDVPGEELLDDASKLSQQMITGEIPDDVQEQLEIMSAEKGIAGGIGQGEGQRNLTARDLGQTSFDIASRGAALAGVIADSRVKFGALKEQRYEFNRKHEATLAEVDVKEATLALSAHELIAANERYAMGLANNLILQNSVNEIQGVQGNIDTLLGTGDSDAFFDPQNASLLTLIEKYTS